MTLTLSPEQIQFNRETVLKLITDNPEKHDQATWADIDYDEDDNVCGTVHCIAGFAALIDPKVKLVATKNIWGDTNIEFRKHGKEADPVYHGMKQLGLSRLEAASLFFDTNTHSGRERFTALVETGELPPRGY